jgi:hypothetical protein
MTDKGKIFDLHHHAHFDMPGNAALNPFKPAV